VPGWGNRWTFWQYDIDACGRGAVYDSNVFNGSLEQLARLAGGTTSPVYRQAPGYVDVNGDGRADLVAQNENGTWVMLSTGSSFSPPVQWSSGAFAGRVANHG
jgi:hypothetical protein